MSDDHVDKSTEKVDGKSPPVIHVVVPEAYQEVFVELEDTEENEDIDSVYVERPLLVHKDRDLDKTERAVQKANIPDLREALIDEVELTEAIFNEAKMTEAIQTADFSEMQMTETMDLSRYKAAPASGFAQQSSQLQRGLKPFSLVALVRQLFSKISRRSPSKTTLKKSGPETGAIPVLKTAPAAAKPKPASPEFMEQRYTRTAPPLKTAMDDDDDAPIEQMFAMSKKAPPMKSRPLSKSAMPRKPEASIAQALKVVESKPAELKSSAFSETRFAKAFENWAESVSTELKESAEQVQKDARNGYAWTFYAKVCKATEADLAALAGTEVLKFEPRDDDECTVVATRAPVENGSFSIEHDPRCVSKFKFKLHPSFVPSTFLQEAPKISRVGWGAFMLGVDVRLRLEGTDSTCGLEFQHYLLLKEDEVGTSESTYLVEVSGAKFVIQIGNTYGMIDDGNQEDGALAGIAKNRANRRERLQRVQHRLEEVRKSQSVIDGFIESCSHKRMGLGAVVAAILNGREMSLESFSALYSHGTSTLRCVVLDETNSKRFEEFMLGGAALGTEKEAYDVSSDASGITIDRFVSHSWFDNAETKCSTILKWAREFQEANGRPARIWCDKFCLKQTAEDLKMSVPCLPIYLLACERVLLLKTKTFLTRLWCLTEVYTNYVMRSGAVKDRGFDIINLDEDTTAQVSVAAARCSFNDDEDALRTNFDRAPGGIGEVEKALQAAMALD